MDLPHRILVAVDKSEESQAALDWALRLAARLGATVVAVHAVGLLEGAGLAEHPDLATIVQQAVARTATPGVGVQVVEEPGPPSEVVLRLVTRTGADLVVLGSRGLGGTQRLLGSTSEAVVTTCTVPVVVIPSGRPPH